MITYHENMSTWQMRHSQRAVRVCLLISARYTLSPPDLYRASDSPRTRPGVLSCSRGRDVGF